MCFYFLALADHLDRPVMTTSFPTRPSSALETAVSSPVGPCARPWHLTSCRTATAQRCGGTMARGRELRKPSTAYPGRDILAGYPALTRVSLACPWRGALQRPRVGAKKGARTGERE